MSKAGAIAKEGTAATVEGTDTSFAQSRGGTLAIRADMAQAVSNWSHKDGLGE